MDRGKKKRVALVAMALAALTAGTLLSSCAAPPEGEEAAHESTITVTDTAGREVTLPYPVSSLVVSDDNQAELIKLLGGEKKVVGIEGSIRERGYYPEMSDKPITGNQWRGLNYEKIAELNPDIVILLGHAPGAAAAPVIEELHKIGVEALCVDTITPEQRVKSIQLLGKILGKEQRAEEYLKWREDILGKLEASLKGLDEEGKRTVLFRDIAFRGTFGKGYPMNRTLEMAGLTNIYDFPGNKEVSPESVVTKNPDIIILGDWEGKFVGYHVATCSAAEKVIQGELEKRPELENTAAAQNNQVFVINYVLTGTRGDIGALYLAKAAYPERLRDIEPVAIHKEYFEEWLGVAYQGTWFCPQPWR
ncbi:MAG: hypothetical protein DRI26_03365 [Chloroflexi bacterium]|nr:MAG: hypothetical protein DRI26_03365 [Chloroflexota bacterium]